MIVPAHKAKGVLQSLLKEPVVVVDTETVGQEENGVKYDALMLHRAQMFSLQIGIPGQEDAFVFLFLPGHLTLATVLYPLAELMQSKQVLKVFHNANYDINVLANAGITVRNYYCTMTAGACYDENLPNSLKERAVLVGMLLKKTKTVDFDNLADLDAYGRDDVVATGKLYLHYEKGDTQGRVVSTKQGFRIRATSGVPRLQGIRRAFYEKQELPMLGLVIRMERRGVRVALQKLAKIDDAIRTASEEHERIIYKYAGGPFNLGSVMQLREVLFRKIGLAVPDTCMTAKGAPSTDSRALFYMKGQHGIIDHLIEYRALSKLREVYTNPTSGLPYYCDRNGYIHATANSVGTHTFRFAYSKPNLSTIPSKKDTFGIRGCIIAPPGYVVVVFDYSQIEVRMQAIFSADPKMVGELCLPNGDIYLRTAKEFNSPDPVAERRMYKVIVLALQYGMGPYNLSDQLTQAGYPTSKTQAKQMIANYFKVYAGIPQMWDRMFAEHEANGCVETLLGRPRKVKDFQRQYSLGGGLGLNPGERSLVNNSMQGSAADWVKQGMLRIDRDMKLRACGYHMLLQIHDEVLGVCPMGKEEAVMKRLTELAVQEPTGDFAPRRNVCVPIKIEIGAGPSWKEAKP